MSTTNEELTLKWGSIKGWGNLSEKSQELLKAFFSEGVPLSAMADKPGPDRRQILCDLIDQLNGTIFNDWDGEYMTKEAAKKYVLEYRN